MALRNRINRGRWFLPPGVLAVVVLCAGVPAHAQQEEDIIPSRVIIITPIANDIVKENVRVEVAVLDELGGSGIARLELLVNNNLFGLVEFPADRATFIWNSKYFANGPATVTARATDLAGNVAPAAAVQIVVDNHPPVQTQIISPSVVALDAHGPPEDKIPPWAAITAPVAGKAGSATIRLEAFAVDNTADTGGTGVTAVEFWSERSGVALHKLGDGAVSGAVYGFNWNTTAADDGDCSITARVRDGAGNSFTSAAIHVRVDNVAPALHQIRADAPVFLWTSPTVLHDGTVTIYMTFDKPGKKYAAMDKTVPPQVQLRLPNAALPLRNVVQQSYYDERGFWIGTVAVNAAADGLGTAIVEVRNARDVAGNSMAPNLRAGYIELVAANPQWPVPHHRVMNNMGITYQHGAPAAPTFRVHEGIDNFEAAGTTVTAIRAGTVIYVDPIPAPPGAPPVVGAPNSPDDRCVTVRVQVGATAAGVSIYQFDNYLHLRNVAVAVGTVVAVGTNLGQVGNNYGTFNHMHLQGGYAQTGFNGALGGVLRYTWPYFNPLTVFASTADRDPAETDPDLNDTPPVAPPPRGRTIYLLRDPLGILLNTPSASTNGPVDILASYTDWMGFFSEVYPLEVGYWIRPQETIGHRMRHRNAPYLLANWINYDVVTDNQAQVNQYVNTAAAYQTQWSSHTYGAYSWLRFHHAILSNAGGLNGDESDRQARPIPPAPAPPAPAQPGQFWYTRARFDRADAAHPCLRENGSDCNPAPINAKALFPDGVFRIEAVASDLRTRLLNVGHEDVIVDNFAPYLFDLRIEQGTDRLRVRYRAGWELNAAETAQALLPATPADRNPRWVNNKNDLVIYATFSEPLKAAPRLLLKRPDGTVREILMSPADVTRARAWKATIPAGDADLAGHKLDAALNDGLEFGFQGQDLGEGGGNELDTDPTTIAMRADATGIFAGYEHAPDPAWGGRVVDHHYRVRIDSKHDDKLDVPQQLQPGP